jgi:hypothetical protein
MERSCRRRPNQAGAEQAVEALNGKALAVRKSRMDDIIPIRKPEIVGEAGGLVDESRLTLAIYGDELDPDEISRLLGCAPTRARRRGDARRSGPPWPQGAWLFSVEGKSPTGPDVKPLQRGLMVRRVTS